MAFLDASSTSYSISMASPYDWTSNYAATPPEDEENDGIPQYPDEPGTGGPWTSTLATSTQYAEVQSYTGTKAVWGGSGLSYSAPYLDPEDGTHRIDPLTGTFTSLSLFSPTGDTIYRITGFTYTVSGPEKPTLDVIFQGHDTIRSGAGKDWLDGFAGNDSIAAGLGDDTVVGGTGNDTIDGGEGFDIVTYEDQTDAISVSFGSTGIATVTSATGTDTLTGSEGVTGGAGNDRISGHATTAAAERFTGGEGRDTIYGGAGDDTIDGGMGLDSLMGSNGVDTVSYASDGIQSVTLDLTTGVATVRENGVSLSEVATGFENFIGSLGNDSVTGTTGANLLDGGEGYDSLNGGNGNDTLVGGLDDAADVLSGGAGDDHYRIRWGLRKDFSYGWDAVVEAAGGGTDTAEVDTNEGFPISYTLGSQLENAILSTDGLYYESFSALGNALNNLIEVRVRDGHVYEKTQSFKLYGGSGNDTLLAAGGADTLNGGSGDDVLSGGLGNDLYVVDSAGDVVEESEALGGVDTIVTRINNLTLQDQVEHLRLDALSTVLSGTGNGGDNRLTGNEFNNSLSGLGGNDTLYGGAGNDTLSGGIGNDYLSGGVGDDLINGGDGIDFVSYAGLGVKISINLGLTTAQATGAGTDTLVGIENVAGGEVGDVLYGSGGNNQLCGLAGNDTLKGNSGNDYLSGGSGNDALYGGLGADILEGGAGADLFVLDFKGTAGSADSIADFVSGSDRIAVSMAGVRIGDGDTLVEGAQTRYASGGFSAAAELLVFAQNLTAPLDANAVAAALGSAASAYAAGDTRLFVVDGGYDGSGTTSAVYLFTSSGADATVSAGELQLLAAVEGQPGATSVADYLFVA